jgi:hypothetical protein
MTSLLPARSRALIGTCRGAAVPLTRSDTIDSGFSELLATESLFSICQVLAR